MLDLWLIIQYKNKHSLKLRPLESRILQLSYTFLYFMWSYGILFQYKYTQSKSNPYTNTSNSAFLRRIELKWRSSVQSQISPYYFNSGLRDLFNMMKMASHIWRKYRTKTTYWSQNHSVWLLTITAGRDRTYMCDRYQRLTDENIAISADQWCRNMSSLRSKDKTILQAW